MKKISKKILSLSLITLIILSNISVTMLESKAASTNKTVKAYYLNVDRAPRVSIKTTYSDYILIKLTERSPIKSVKIEEKVATGKYESILSTDNANKIIQADLNVSISKDKRTIKINKEFFNVKEPKYIRITTSDGDKYSNKLVANYKITRLENKNSKGRYYSVNSSPRKGFKIEYYKTKKETLQNFNFTIKDNNGHKLYKIVDLNNNGKVIDSDTTGDTSSKYHLYSTLTGLKAKNGMYKIKITLKDNIGMTSTEVIYLQIRSKKVKESEISNGVNINESETQNTNSKADFTW